MSELSQEVDQLQAAVDGVAQRLLPEIQTLRAERDSLSADAQAAVDRLGTEVDRLNSLGTDPSTPVDPNPSDPVTPPDVETPADPTADPNA